MHFADVHVHLLPGLDDGPVTLEETLRMLRVAHDQGIRSLAATPHMFLPPYNNDAATVTAAFAELREALEVRSREPEHSFLRQMSVHPGSESYLSPELLDALETRQVVAINGGSYLLVEFPPFLALEMLVSAVERIAAAGFIPVLAHVERYPVFQESSRRLAELVERGCISQVNASGVAGTHGRRLKKHVTSLLRRGLVHVIASDAHGARDRAPDLKGAFEALKKQFPQEKIRAWMLDNPVRILRNKGLSPLEPS